jgi:hypothetical protein
MNAIVTPLPTSHAYSLADRKAAGVETPNTPMPVPETPEPLPQEIPEPLGPVEAPPPMENPIPVREPSVTRPLQS